MEEEGQFENNFMLCNKLISFLILIMYQQRDTDLSRIVSFLNTTDHLFFRSQGK